SILIQGTRAMEVFSVAPTSLTKYGQEINQWAEANPKIKVYALLAPTSLEFYGPDDYRTENHSALRAMKIVYEQMTAKNITTVETRNPIAKHVDEYIYFRTDHHWTARGAYYAYTAFCKAAGLKATNLKDHQSGTIQDFVGSYYRYTNSATLKENPDYVEYFMPLSQVTGTVWSDADTSKEGRSVEAINTNITQSNKYLCFIAGDNPVERFVTSNKNGKKIVIIKESYGNAFAPWLMDNYEEVWVLDPRKVDTNLTDFITKNGINEVLFLNYAFAPSNPTYMTAFTKMLS
ncbi:MAG TPA: DHHW family protein, partial [Clostridiales bacterium]|nr:DHHW family protein [Clostridiales bacterium]